LVSKTETVTPTEYDIPPDIQSPSQEFSSYYVAKGPFHAGEYLIISKDYQVSNKGVRFNLNGSGYIKASFSRSDYNVDFDMQNVNSFTFAGGVIGFILGCIIALRLLIWLTKMTK
jgi:hypothetical protein